MTDEDKQLIAHYEGFCGTCKYFESSLFNPTESTNTWETWFYSEAGECRRYPPVFVGGWLDCKNDDDEYAEPNWQRPKIYSFSKGCGEYVRALWVPCVK